VKRGINREDAGKLNAIDSSLTETRWAASLRNRGRLAPGISICVSTSLGRCRCRSVALAVRPHDANRRGFAE
jgi:hypothetical protein